jgi:hypothetical protein
MIKNFLVIALGLTCFSKSLKSQDLGKSLAFQGAVTLSNDTLFNENASVPTILITKTYTVPEGHILKINSGKLQTNQGITDYVLTINGQNVIANSTALTFSSENSVWAAPGTQIKLTTKGNKNALGSFVSSLSNFWISGVLFKILEN